MSSTGVLAVAVAAFVGLHFVMSHPLRPAMVGRLGDKGFQGVYSLIILATFAWLVWAAWAVEDQPPLWLVGDALWVAASLLMWLGSILLIGSFVRNPAFPRVGAPITRIEAASGVFKITRHPMNWAFALWALVHAIANPTAAGLLLPAGFLILALGGSAAQDRKKRRLLGDVWVDWEARTAFVPFGRGLASPGAFALIGGTVLFLAATWAHGALGSIPAGPWRWLG